MSLRRPTPLMLFTGLLVAIALTLTFAATSARAALSFSKATVGLDYPPTVDDNSTETTFDDVFPLNANEGGTFVTPKFQRQAGSHPDLTVFFEVSTEEHEGIETPTESVRDVDVDLPVGFVGDPTGMAECDPLDLSNPGVGNANCPVASQIGLAELVLGTAGLTTTAVKVPLYNIGHGAEVPALFGFNYLGVVSTVRARVRPGDYGISSAGFAIAQSVPIKSVKVTVWGVPADPIHDVLRLKRGVREIDGPLYGPGVGTNSGENPSWPFAAPISFPPFFYFGSETATDAPRVPLLNAPTSCSDEPSKFAIRGDSWEEPGVFDERTLKADGNETPFNFEGCDRLSFNPTVDVQPLSTAAHTSTGLSVDLDVPQSDEPDGLATAHVRKVEMTLPRGMTVSTASAAGLGACSPAEIGLGNNNPPACPSSSKLGTVKIDTPVLPDPLQGDLYIAKQNDNPFDSLLALYIVAKGPGIWIKLPGRIELDPDTGQVTSIFDDNPQLPFNHLSVKFFDGPRGALTTPAACGTYNTHVAITSWASNDPVELNTPMVIDKDCASGGFAPKLSAGTVNPTGGAYSPFLLRITRQDGETNLSRIQATLPEGLLAKLGGVPLCPDSAAATGACPASSQVGTVIVGAGAGTNPLYVPEPGKAPTAAYLAGPYKGGPYSLVVKVPAQAGPFDLGTVTVRNALNVDPTTTQVTATSDPLPQILQGIPIAYRDVRIEINRPGFTLNPTSCKAMAVTSVLTSATGQTATPSSSFQASGCKELGFGPSLKISLKGKMKRTGNPSVKAVLKAPKGQANIAKTTVVLPPAMFIDNSHINNPCTRVQFNANECPAGSILGKATAYSPLLDKPLSGPVYFRSNGGDRELPDLVADLKGQIHVTLVGFIDTAKSGGVRTRFADVPDAPVSQFVLRLSGGRKGLIENSRDLCSFAPKAKVQMTGQNGKTANSNLKLGTSCG